MPLACGSGTPPGPERIVLVTLDTVRADRLGCYGDTTAHTPHLDTLASEGVRFQVALSPAPLTLPAHASLMTGVDPPQHGVRHNSIHRLGPELPTLAEGLRGAGYTTAAFVGALVLDRRFGLARGFDRYDDRTAGRSSGATGYAERTADAVVDAALAWLETAPERFFLWVHVYDPHAAYAPPPGFASAFAADPYAGEIAFVDHELGRLFDALRALGPPEELLIVATSDHGEALGEHGEPTHSYSIYEATQRVPLILAGAGLPAGLVAPGPVGLVDIAPTLLAWTGAPPLPEARGEDLRVAARRAHPSPRPFYMETLATQLDFGWSPLVGVRADGWKLVRAPRPELFDLRADPDEESDLADEHPERRAALEAALDAWEAGRREPTAIVVPAADRDRLRSLGYVVPEGELSAGALGRVGGVDPKERMALLATLAEAQAALEGGEAATALRLLDGLHEGGPHVGAVRAAAALAAGEVERAERYARVVLAEAPARSDVRILLARARDAMGDAAGADRALAQLDVDVAPAPWVALRAARAELAAGDPARASTRLATARERFAQDPRLALGHAQALDALGDDAAALDAREAALAAAPDSLVAANDVAFGLARAGRDLDRALALAQRAADAADEDPAVLDTLARVHVARGEAQAALAVIDRALPRARGALRQQLTQLAAGLRSPAD